MAETGTAEANGDPQPLSLEPFTFLAGARSKIAGLGGPENSPDPDYVFHTEYHPVAEGHANFHVRFSGLTGKFGTFVFRVHMYQQGAADVRLVTSARVLLSRMVQLGGVYDMRFEAFHGVSYALYCGVQGDTDGAADSLELALDRPASPDDTPQIATEARNSDFGRDAVQPSTHIVSIERATLALPVSQICTAPQLRERTFRDLAKRFSSPTVPLEQWGAAYLLQVLDRYGMLAAGARGLALGATASPLPALVAQAEASVLVLGRHEDGDAVLADIQAMAPNDAETFRRNVSYRAMPGDLLAKDLVNFDFVWTDRVLSQAGSVTDGIALAQKAMAALRPGGLAVHLIDFALTADARGDLPDVTPFERRDLDRLALVLISRNHEVAQIKIDRQNPPTARRPGDQAPTGITLCGLIARKAQTVE